MDNGEKSYTLFLEGDERGLVQIIRDYKDGLILYLNGYVCDLTVAEDLTEDAFLKLVLKKPRFSACSSFKTWLYTIGRNLALDYLKRNKKKELSLDECLDLADEGEGLEAAYIQQEDKIAIRRVMKKLKQEYQQVLWLIYFEGFTCGEAGKIMGKSQHNMETLVYRARLALKSKLLEEGFKYEKL